MTKHPPLKPFLWHETIKRNYKSDSEYYAFVKFLRETIKRNYKLPRESAILVHTLVETIKRNYKGEY